MQFFHDLGLFVERLWREQSYDEDRFPHVADKALTKMSPVGVVGPLDIIRWVCETNELPEQHDIGGTFGDLPVTLYDGPGFFIDGYFWLDGTTAIHHPAFSGAFQVLTGSSILSLYKFAERQRVEAHMSIGTMTLSDVELLEQGAVRQILPGSGYIHSLFHLERPSVTIVVRTRRTEKGWPQYEYLKPYFAINPSFNSHSTSKKLQTASLLLRMRHPDSDYLIGLMLAESGFHTTFSILDLVYDHFTNDWVAQAFGMAQGEDRFRTLLEIARQHHGESVNLIVPVIEELRRQRYLIQRRAQITSIEHRYLLALLLCVPDRKLLIELVKERFPEQDPVDSILSWVEELGNTRVMGSSEPNVLGVEDFDESFLLVLEGLLEGLGLNQIKNKFQREFAPDDPEEAGNQTQRLYDEIRKSMFFKSIFSEAPSVGRPPRTILSDKPATLRGRPGRGEKKESRTSQ